jgi:hypothetical protein
MEKERKREREKSIFVRFLNIKEYKGLIS